MGKDGRNWTMDDPTRVLRALAGRTLILDENHSTYLKAPQGEPAPAMARLSNFTIHEDGSIWAENVEWTARGQEAYANGDYLGLSPVVMFDPSAATEQVLGNVTDIHSVALVNDPNLPIPALNSREIMSTPEKKPEAKPEAAPAVAPVQHDVPKLIADALAPFAAMFASLQEQVTKLAAPKAETVAAPNAADVEAAANAARVAHEQTVSAACEKLISAGKLTNTPEARASFKAMCPSLAALNSALAYFEKAPAVVATSAANLGDPNANKPAYTADQIKICKMFGRTPEEAFKD